ncbi:MAG: ABC transporter ATP-binding protein [Bacteroidota bacterium]
MIIADGIKKSYHELQVLKGIHLEIKTGEIVSIVGASGAGKSTLLHILGTLDRSDSGKITIGGEETTKMNARRLAAFRNKNIGFVFQQHHLLPEFTAMENICMPALIAGTSKNEAEKKALQLLELMNLADRASHRPAELSGGEQQRIAVARALVNDPKVVFADEPSGNLDSTSAQSLHQLFFDLRKRLNQTFVIVTHNTHLADMADRKLTMKDGVIV